MATITVNNILRKGDIKDNAGADVSCGAAVLLTTQAPTVTAADNTVTVTATSAGAGATLRTNYALDVTPSSDAGNTLTSGTDGKLFVATGSVTIDPNANNKLTSSGSGLLVNPSDSITFTACDGTVLGTIKGWF